MSQFKLQLASHEHHNLRSSTINKPAWNFSIISSFDLLFRNFILFHVCHELPSFAYSQKTTEKAHALTIETSFWWKHPICESKVTTKSSQPAIQTLNAIRKDVATHLNQTWEISSPIECGLMKISHIHSGLKYSRS